MVSINELDFTKGNGLIPAVVQEYATKDVLMLAYVNEDALAKTVETGFAHYWSRSRQQLWKKGETSGNTQRIRQILIDCDSDTILYIVHQKGPACHTGETTCFHNKLDKQITE
jgi:phosphoribosyl-AMP cyclohydrolase